MTAFFTRNRQTILVGAALALILLVGAAFRFQALQWDQGQSFHPDERAIISYTQPINTIPTTGADNAPRKSIDFPPGGLGFFIPNDKTNLRPATAEETDAFYQAQRNGQRYNLPANVIAPDQAVPAEAINFWNPNFSPLNPRWFAYGSFPIYLIKFGGHIMTWITGQTWYDFDHLMRVGRFLSGLWSMGTLLLVFLLGRQVFAPSLGRKRGDAIGLLAAAFMAVSVLDIQLAHFAAFDVALTFFITLALYMAVRLMRSGKWMTALGLGAAIGLALACKVSAAPVVGSAVVAALLYGLYGRAKDSGEQARRPRLRAWPGREAERYGPEGVALGPRLLTGTLLNLILVGLMSLLVWFVAMPYAFIDFANWSKRVIEEAGMSRGVDSFPYTRQYVGTVPFLYQAGNLVQWGLGIPLGLLAIIGLFYSLWQAVARRIKAELVILTFMVIYSLTTFTAEAKFNRYLLPVLPLLVILAARLIVELASPKLLSEQKAVAPKRGKLQNLKSYAIAGLALFAFGWAGVWALAFSQIYSADHTMNQATRWMFQNIPNGVSFSNELWDESLPTRITSDNYATHSWCDQEVLTQGGGCVPVSMDLYGDAPNNEKVDYFVNQIKKTDYITIASNRLYATMPKLPWRYPIQIRYYELLFSGKLGYEQVATFTDYPKIPLLNWEINDDSADESFTVYDHPKVFIFKKTQKLTDEELRGLFANAAKAPWIPERHPSQNELPVQYAGQGDGVLDSATAGQYRQNGKNLLLDRPVDRLPVVDDWMGWFQLANDNQWLAVIVWFALIQLLGLVALPIAWRVCRRLPDRGYILAKPLGAVIVALVIWLLVWTRFFMNTVWTAWLALALTAAFSAWLGWRNRRELVGWLAAHRKIIIWEESIFLFIFLGWLLFRIGNPDLWHPFFGGEKPMEMTHMLGILRSPYFPPYDPWFSDGYINYYFYGQYLVSTWVKLSGISPFIAFNLALPVLYAFTCTGAFSLVYNLSLKYKQHRARLDPGVNPNKVGGPITAGLFGVVIFGLVGNMDGFLQVLQRFQPLTDLANSLKLYPDPIKTAEKFDYFRSSRIIPGTINEFPSFSFIYADLHAHVAALPFTLVAMALAFNLMSTNWIGHSETKANGKPDFFQMTVGRLWQVFDRTLVTPVILMVVIGFLGATNSWDMPTYLLLVTVSVFMALFRRYFTPKAPLNEQVLNEGVALDNEPSAISHQPSAIRLKYMLPSLLIDLVLTGAVFGAVLLGGLGLYWNFFGNFYAFFSKIALLPDFLDTNSYKSIHTMSSRTDLKYIVVIFLLPLFLVLSYLIWNSLNWWGRKPHPARSNAKDDEDEWDDEYEEINPEGYEQPTLPGFNLSLRMKRPELALTMAGAGGSSNAEWSGDSGPGASGVQPRSPRRFARSWLVGLLVFNVFTLTIGIFAPHNWLVFTIALTIVATCVVLTFVRVFDRRHPEQSSEAQDESGMFLRIMLIAAFGLIAACEVIYLADDMEGSEFTRMNTVFKFYYQVWALMCLAGAAASYVLWVRWIAPTLARYTQRKLWGQTGRFAWIGVVVLMVLCAATYPAQAIPTRIQERASTPLPAPTLDGRAYYKTLKTVTGMPIMPAGLTFDHTFEAQSLFEFYDKVKGTPVVLQASIWPYRGGGSWIPINTGLPTLLGWDHHERQQRWSTMVVNRSDKGGTFGQIREIYNTESIQEALELLNHFHVTYIHLGIIEREAQLEDKCNADTGQCTYLPYMSEEGYAKFEQMVRLGLLDVAYQNPGVVVYKMTGKGESGVVTGDIKAVGGVSITDPKLSRLEAAVQASPNDVLAHYNLGQYYYTKKDYAKATAELETVIKLEPNRINPYHVLGDIYRDAGDTAKALDTYKRATQAQGPAEEMPAAFNKYGVALQQAGQYEEALKQFEQTIKLNKLFNEAYFHEGETYEAMGQKDAAIAAYQQTIVNSQKKDDFWTQRANQKIRELSNK
jgi:YYY domain-containing protein